MDSLTELYNEIAQEEEIEVPKPRPKEKEPKARTYLQSVIEEIELYLSWDNNTVESDRRLIYMKLCELAKKKSDTAVRLIINWAKGKNLHPKQLVKAINKAL